MANLLHDVGTTPVPPITKLLSQYELLQSVCNTLSSADITHLAATCKEHRTYIAFSKATLTNLLSTAHCDGRGIVAQARVFGYWEDDSAKAPGDAQCLGADAQPCSECGAQVCDNCRFHFYYDGLRGWDEREFAEDIEDEGTATFKLPNHTIESGKAFDVFWNYDRRTFCDAHEPLIIGFDNRFQTCHCDFYDHFVGNRWLCLPFFFVEEAKTYPIKVRKIVRFEEGKYFSGHARKGYEAVDVCDCGALSRLDSITICRRCDRVEGFQQNRDKEMLEKILAQLG